MNHDNILRLIGGFRQWIPPVFYRVFSLARLLEQQGVILNPEAAGKWQKLCQPTENPREEVRSEVANLSKHGHTVRPIRRRIHDMEELPLVDREDRIGLTPARLLLAVEEGELKVTSFPRQGNKAPETSHLEPNGGQGALQNNEQSLYILLDYSYSMRESWRMSFAQALVLHYLAKKYEGRHRPRLFFRAFAINQSPLVQARHWDEIGEVVRAALIAEPDEKGTDIQGALLTAIADIKYHCTHTKAEILMVTDGMAVINPEAINRQRGDIQIHMLKIGSDEIQPVESQRREILRQILSTTTGDVDETVQGFFVGQIFNRYRDVCQTILQIPDLAIGSIKVLPSEVQEIASQLHPLLAQPPATADLETHRLVVFYSNLLSFLQPHCQGDLATQVTDLFKEIDTWLARRLSPDRLAEILSSCDLHLTLEKNLLRQARRADLKKLLAHKEVRLALKLWHKSGTDGPSIPRWMIIWAIIRSIVRSLFSSILPSRGR